MARRFVTVIIDDLYLEAGFMIETLRRYSSIHPVSGIDDVIDELDAIESSQTKIVDIIMCDVNMDKDDSPRPFKLKTEKVDVQLTPSFSMENGKWVSQERGGNGAGSLSRLKPYGPILALPFTRYFEKGGVIQPISNYWHHPRLVDTVSGHMDGYVYVCLRLIMDQGGAIEEGGTADFGNRFSAMYGDAVDATTATLYEEQFKLAVSQRRAQLLGRAHAIEGLDQVSIETVRSPGEVAIWSEDGRVDRIERISMFADYAIQLDNVERQASPKRLSKALAELDKSLRGELAGYPSGLDIKALCEFCRAFVDVMDGNDGGTFIQRYAEARLESRATDPTVPAPCEPVALKSHLRRYLLLTAQLYIYASKVLVRESDHANALSEAAMNKALCGALGIPNTTQRLKEFAYGARNQKIARKRSAGDRFARPFWASEEFVGWQEFNLLRRQREGEGYWDWDDLDRCVAQAVWEQIGEEREALPHGLDAV